MRGKNETIKQYLESIGKNPDEFLGTTELALMLGTSREKAKWLMHTGWLESVIEVEKSEQANNDGFRARHLVDRMEVISIQRGYHKYSVQIAEYVANCKATGPMSTGGWLDGKRKIAEEQKEESETSQN